MPVSCLLDLREDETIRQYISRCCWRGLSAQERGLADVSRFESGIGSLLDTLPERDDLALVLRTAEQDLVGYALLTEHRNEWTGSLEGFVYALHVEESVAAGSLAEELFAAVRDEARERHYRIVRAEVPEAERSGPLIDRLHALGWSTSGLIPCILPPSAGTTVAEGGVHVAPTAARPDLRVRRAGAPDFAFVVGALAEAVWAGLSAWERSQLTLEALRAGVRDDFGPALRDGTCVSYVAESPLGTLAAHATARFGYTHPTLDIPEAELVDIFMPPALLGRGVGGQFTARIYAECLDRGVHLLRASVVVENTAPARVEHLRARLVGDGWWFNTRVMYRLLGD